MIPTTTHTKHHLAPSESSAPKRQKTNSSNFNIPHRYTPLDSFLLKMGMDITTLILSYLPIEQIAEFATKLNSPDLSLQMSLDLEVCSTENRIPLMRSICGYETQKTASGVPITSSAATTERTFVYSPVVVSQLRDRTDLSNNITEKYAEFGFPLEIFWTVGKSVKKLWWATDYPPDSPSEILAQKTADFIIGASQHCPNIESIEVQGRIVHPPLEVFAERISNWPHLQHLSTRNCELINLIPTKHIKSLQLFDYQDYSSDVFFIQIGEKFPFLTSLTLIGINFKKCPLKLATKCSTLESLSINSDLIFQRPDPEDMCALIAKCPIRSLELLWAFSPSILEALLIYERHLEEASFNLNDPVFTPDLLNSFFETQRASLRSFKSSGRGIGVNFFSILLKFVSDNPVLKELHLAFLMGDPKEGKISLENLSTFLKKCAHIDEVLIDLINLKGNISREYLDLAKKTYSNIDLSLESDESDDDELNIDDEA